MNNKRSESSDRDTDEEQTDPDSPDNIDTMETRVENGENNTKESLNETAGQVDNHEDISALEESRYVQLKQRSVSMLGTPLKALLTVVLVLGFIYWLLVYLEMAPGII